MNVHPVLICRNWLALVSIVIGILPAYSSIDSAFAQSEMTPTVEQKLVTPDEFKGCVQLFAAAAELKAAKGQPKDGLASVPSMNPRLKAASSFFKRLAHEHGKIKKLNGIPAQGLTTRDIGDLSSQPEVLVSFEDGYQIQLRQEVFQ
ncbi:MAG: hypothetical protein U0136_22185 [Bdellovibrionota bacterium]